MRVLIAPDKFKGTLTAESAAAAIAEGWSAARPDDELVLRPMADGGDGTAAVLAAALPGSDWVAVDAVDAIGRPRQARYLRSGDLAVVELALVCGLGTVADLPVPDAMNASTRGLGIVLRAAMSSGATKVLVTLGGSASTDGGAGALAELPARPHLPVDVLVDVDSPLLGPYGAAQTFAPQKGATPAQVEALEARLRAWAAERGGDPDEPGAGAAGGTGFGLASWGASLLPGAATVADLIGLPADVAGADIVVTGEGRFDATSLRGKVCGCVLELPGSARRFVIAGSADPAVVPQAAQVVTLEERTGSAAAAQRLAAPTLAATAREIALALAD